jgi:hypothetical protein
MKLKKRSKTKLVGSLKTLVQCKNRWHHKTWRLESCVCKSRKRGCNLPSHHNRDSRSTKRDQNLKIYYKRNAKTPEKGTSFQLIENTKVRCKNDNLIIPASLQHRAVSWYHHYLQHPGHSHLKEAMRSVMYWKGMRRTIGSYAKSCRSCQVNKRHSQKYGYVPPKLVITTPW